MKISVIIVNYNVEHFLEQCLQSVELALKKTEGEVIVIDNLSVDGSVSMVRSKFPWVKLIENKENTGFSRANNQGIRIASGEYVLLLNPDTVIEEDTLQKVVEFMDVHPDGGGLGVHMVDGQGHFLPESKRGLPTPEVAFYKIFGVSRIFPRSKRFNKYYLGHLSKDETNEVEILSGAFMLMRKSVLDKVGLLDEEFFMYGEDIDLSWRIILGGYKNFYYPDTTIIHYKGESTKKGSLNYVFVFYNAMIIFARKHFSEQNARLFSFFINLAIYFRAGIAIAHRFVRRVWMPLMDAILIFFGLQVSKHYYEISQDKIYDEQLVATAFGVYALVWVFSMFMNGVYDKPFKWVKSLKGVIIGSVVILLGYALLPEWLRFSRALILIGSAFTALYVPISRFILSFVVRGLKDDVDRRSRNIAIIGSDSEITRVSDLLQVSKPVSMNIIEVGVGDELSDTMVGDYKSLDAIVRVHHIDEVIYCAKDLSPSKIISMMGKTYGRSLDFRIAPSESEYIIGSNSIQSSGDLFLMDVNSINKPKNRRVKRFTDVMVSLVLLLISPVAMWFVAKPFGLIPNIFRVLFNKRTWVGFHPGEKGKRSLPAIKKGVLNPLSHLPKEKVHKEMISRANLIYAKDYRWSNDIQQVMRGFRKLGEV